MTTEELIEAVASRPTTEKLVLLGLHVLGSRSLSSLATSLGLSNSGSLRGCVADLTRAGLICRGADRTLSLVGSASDADSTKSAPSIMPEPPPSGSEKPPTSPPASPPPPESPAPSPAPPTEWRPKKAIKVRELLSEDGAEMWDRLGERLGPDAWVTWASAALTQHFGVRGKTPLSPHGLEGCLAVFVGNNADLAYPLWKAYLKRAAEKEAAPELALGSTTPSRTLIE